MKIENHIFVFLVILKMLENLSLVKLNYKGKSRLRKNEYNYLLTLTINNLTNPPVL